MRERSLRDTGRRSPPPGKFPGADITHDNRRPDKRRFPGSRSLELERSMPISPPRRTERHHPQGYIDGGGRRVSDGSCNITQYSKSVAQGESASLKFRWNNLLYGELENAPMKNPVSGIGYGTITSGEICGFSEGDGFLDSGVVSMGTARNYGRSDVGFISPLRKNEGGLPNKSEFPMPLHWDQQQQHGATTANLARPLYSQGGETMPGPRVSLGPLGYSISVSQPNASSSGSLQDHFPGSFQDGNLPCFSLGFSRSIGMPADGYFVQDVHGQMPKSYFIENSKAQLMKLADYGHVQPCFVEIMDRDSNYSEMQRSEHGDMGLMSDDYYGNMMATHRGEFRHQDSRRPSIVDSIVDKVDGIPGSHGDPLRKGVSWEENLSSEELLTPKYYGPTQPSKSYVELSGSGNIHPDYSTEGCMDSDGWNSKCYRKDACTTNYQESWKGRAVPALDHDQYFYKHDGILDGMSKTEELVMHDLDGEMFKIECSSITHEHQVWTDFNSSLPHSRCASVTFDDEETTYEEDIMHVQFDNGSTSPYPAVLAQRKSRNHKMIIGKGIKKKLRPARTIPLPNSLVSSRRNVHDRLGPRVVSTASPYTGKYKKKQNLKKNLHDFYKTSHCSDLSDVKVKHNKTKPPEDSQEFKEKHNKTKPPEDSKEFKQLVQNAFYKFVKLLNENPAQRRKYTDQGGTGTLKCSLCGSKSKEFANTVNLATHAFESRKAECRAEHLGFHKALCVLLGWGDTATSDGLWVQRMLSAAEAANLKNDLIIWPPVVLVHNSSIVHYNPDERMIVSIKGLEAILMGMGFGGGKTKVYRGKPANYSILVVTFSATFSGLQEAERLHKFYADNKRGRAEFQQIDGSSPKTSNEQRQDVPGNEERVLYGYLGNAGDLDKLDFESKKHSVVRSKEEIQDIAVASLRADQDNRRTSSFRMSRDGGL